MNRRTLLEAVGTTGLLGLGAGAAAADVGSEEVSSDCTFECCEDCQVAYCPDGCECDRYCEQTVK